MALGAAASGVLLWRRFRAFVPALTLVRVGVAAVATIGIGRVLPDRGKIVTLLEAAVCAAAFLAVLVGTGELGRADLGEIRRGLGRKA
jgi:hypothetical protein